MPFLRFFLLVNICFLLLSCSPLKQTGFKNSVDNLFVHLEQTIGKRLKIERQSCVYMEQKFHAVCEGKAFTSDGSQFQFLTLCPTSKRTPCKILALTATSLSSQNTGSQGSSIAF